jgi:hypothetical protein
MSVEQTVVMEMGLYSDELRPRIELTDDASYLRFLIRQQGEMSQMYEKKLVLKQNQIDALENRKDTMAVECQWKESYEIMEKRNEEHLKSIEKNFKDRYELMEKRVEIYAEFKKEYENEISDLKYKLNEMRIDRDEYKYSLDNRDQEVLRLTAKLSDKQI